MTVSNIKTIINRIRWGKITSKNIATVSDNVISEIEFYDKNGKVIGYWAYGEWDPNCPYKGDF